MRVAVVESRCSRYRQKNLFDGACDEDVVPDPVVRLDGVIDMKYDLRASLLELRPHAGK